MRRTASDTSSRAKDEKTKEPTGVGLLAISGMAKRGFRGERHMRSRMTDIMLQDKRRRRSCRAFRRWKRLRFAARYVRQSTSGRSVGWFCMDKSGLCPHKLRDALDGFRRPTR